MSVTVTKVNGKSIEKSVGNLVDKTSSVLKGEMTSLLDINKKAVLEGGRRGNVRKFRLSMKKLLRKKMGPQYQEFMKNGGELADAMEQVFLWNAAHAASRHLKDKVPGAGFMEKVAEESLVQTYQEKYDSVLDLVTEIAEESLGEFAGAFQDEIENLQQETMPEQEDHQADLVQQRTE